MLLRSFRPRHPMRPATAAPPWMVYAKSTIRRPWQMAIWPCGHNDTRMPSSPFKLLSGRGPTILRRVAALRKHGRTAVDHHKITQARGNHTWFPLFFSQTLSRSRIRENSDAQKPNSHEFGYVEDGFSLHCGSTGPLHQGIAKQDF